MVPGYLVALVRGQAPVILDMDSEQHDWDQRTALVAGLQSRGLGFSAEWR